MAAPSRMPQYEVRNQGAGPFAAYRCEICGREFPSRPADLSLGDQNAGNLLGKLFAAPVNPAEVRGLNQQQLNAAWNEVIDNFRECQACHKIVCKADFDEAHGMCKEDSPAKAKSAAAKKAPSAKSAEEKPAKSSAAEPAVKKPAAKKAAPKDDADEKATKTPAVKTSATKTSATKTPAVKTPAVKTPVAKAAAKTPATKAAAAKTSAAKTAAKEAQEDKPARSSSKTAKTSKASAASPSATVEAGAAPLAQDANPFLQAATQVFDQLRMRNIPMGDADNLCEVFFTTPAANAKSGGLDERLAASLDKARKSIDVAVFDFDLENVAEALARAAKRGVQVRMVVDTDNLKQEAGRIVKRAGIKIVGDKREAFMHNKFIIIDLLEVWTGSWNLTFNCTYKNNNNAVVIRSADLAKNYTNEFNEMFEQKDFGASRTPHVTRSHLRVGNIKIENYFAPEDDVFSHILPVIQNAQKSIRFLAFAFTEDTLRKLIVEKRKAGLIVQGVMDARNASGVGAELASLRRAKIDVLMDGNPYAMHDKVIIVDDEVVITGSFNFTGSAQQSNDENVVFLYSPEIARKYTEEFQRIYRVAKEADQK